ncbi:hypothetical protein HDV00_008209 [Rhizophlyctis rosea]|nr:hypothetical protein HDV00_008209 [Rhizophlyctis rosea]
MTNANDQSHGFVSDSNGFIRSTLHLSPRTSSQLPPPTSQSQSPSSQTPLQPQPPSTRRRPPTFTPKLLLDLLLTALHIPLSSSKLPNLTPCRPKRLRFSKQSRLVTGVLDDFASLLDEIRLGIEIAPSWDEDLVLDEATMTGEEESGQEEYMYGIPEGRSDAFFCRRWSWKNEEDFSGVGGLDGVDSLDAPNLEDWSLWQILWAMLTLIPIIHVMAGYLNRLKVAQPHGRYGAAGGGEGAASPVPVAS